MLGFHRTGVWQGRVCNVQVGRVGREAARVPKAGSEKNDMRSAEPTGERSSQTEEERQTIANVAQLH